MNSIIDLHIHTNASDGTDSPRDLLCNIQKAGINTFAITDHDTITGAIAMTSIIPEGLRFVKGIEFSCRAESGHRCHILGLNYDETNSEFQDALRAGDDLRHKKFHKRIELLRSQFGITFSDNEMEQLIKIPSVGKPHLANLIVSKGLAKNRQEAISRYIDKCRTGTGRISAELAISAILSSGGVPVWAHPLGGEGERELSESGFMTLIDELMSYGLKGLECWYSKYTPEKCEWLSTQAEKRDLLISGGSDYHGTNKNIPLGRLNADNLAVNIDRLTILKYIQGA